ncbi:MAG TPA: TIGR04282 family arsenosugar biosynthesis glycosyltransferase [Vicinamibacteria bacterium]|nr:TIGR04282 family arsenosugar biosynthesis glycosyltransferase [Vicinamibacteria bacterium]
MSASGCDVLLVFLKAPRPGAVKTRLAAALGKEAAAELYRVLAEAEVRRTAPRREEYERRFCFTPPGARAAMKAWFPGEVFVPQEGADLGARMARAFDQAFREGARRVAIIGGDVPAVSRETVREAFRSLQSHDVVLGPARDGGYYLLALNHPCPALFSGMAWGTATVLAATVKKAGRRGMAVRQLGPLTDIDTLEDLRTEWRRLAPLLATRPALRRGVARALGRSPRATG